jgi:hypothetical protein
VEHDPTSTRTGAVRRGTVGSLVAFWWFADGLVQLAVIVLAAFVNPLVVLAVAFVILMLINTACCNWVERHWNSFMTPGGRVEKKLTKIRSGRFGGTAAGWIERGSDFWFGLAAALTNAITTVGLGRLISGKPTSERRILIASAGFSLFVAALGAVLGFVLGDAIRAL